MKNIATQQSIENIRPVFDSIEQTEAIYQMSEVTYNESGLTYNDSNTMYGGSDTVVDKKKIMLSITNTTPSQNEMNNL